MKYHRSHKNAFESGLRPVAMRVMIATVVAAGLAGCRDEYGGHRFVGWEAPATVAERHPIVVDKESSSLDVAVSTHASGLNDFQKVQVAEFIGQYRHEGVGRISVQTPSGTANEGAAYRVVSDVKGLLRGAGIPSSAVDVQAYHAGGGKPPVKLSFVRYVAHGPDCGKWPTNLVDEPRNQNYWNFGCAQQHNLAAMIANPRDLVEPRDTWQRPSERRDVTWDKWVGGKSTISETADDEKAGIISDVAKQ